MIRESNMFAAFSVGAEGAVFLCFLRCDGGTRLFFLSLERFCALLQCKKIIAIRL